MTPTELKSMLLRCPTNFNKSWNTFGLAKNHNESCDGKGQGTGPI